MEPNVQADQAASEPVKRLARELLVGDVITPAMLPWTQRLTEVIFTDTYALHGEHWTFVAYKDEDGHRDHALFEANRLLPLERAADPIGLAFGRGDEGPQLDTATRRVDSHWAAMEGRVGGGQLVDADEPENPDEACRIAGFHIPPCRFARPES